MKTMMKTIGLSLLSVFVLLVGVASAEEPLKIGIEGKFDGLQVQLRWMVSDKSIDYRYVVWRSPADNLKQRKKIAELSLLPYSEAKTRLADNVAALKLMYPFETAENRAELNQSLAQDDNRLGMLLFVSTQDKQVAAAMGQYAVDSDLTGNAKRLYTVEVYNGSTLLASDTCAVDLEKSTQLPIVWQVKAHMFKWGVGLKWQGYEAYTSFNIYRRGLLDKEFTQINTVPIQVQSTVNPDGTISVAPYFYTDTAIKENQQFYYQIRGVDLFGDEGPSSVEVRGKIQVDPRPAPLSRPTLDAGETTIKLSWQAAEGEGIVGYNLYRSLKHEGGYQKLNAAVLTQLNYTDLDVVVDTNYFYYITAVNEGGFESIPSLAALGFAKDATPPAVVAELNAIVVEANINLSWTKVEDADLQGYRVYRTMKPESLDWVLLTQQPIAEVAFTDALTKNLSRYPYYYRVTAVDTHHNESAPSMVVKAQLPDVTAPQTPILSDHTMKNEQVILTWQPVTVYDFAGYNVYRSQGASTQKLTATLLPLPTFVDQTAPIGEKVSYSLTSVDFTGNESAPTKPLNITVTDATAPRITRFDVTSDGGFAVLTVESADKDMVGFDVFRSQNNRDYVKVNRRRIKEASYRDQVLKGKRYFYKIVVWDRAANQTQSVSKEVKIAK